MPNRLLFVKTVLFLSTLIVGIDVCGQAPNWRAADAMVSAQIGEPFGVATIEVPLATGVDAGSMPPLRATDSAGRVLYPVANETRQRVIPPSERPVPEPGRGRLLNRLGGLIRELTGNDKDKEITVSRRVSFLFRSDQPIRVTVSDIGGTIGTYDLVPQSDPLAHGQLLERWWGDYTTGVQTQVERGDYPPWVETYLVAMLSGRLHLPLPRWFEINPNQEDTLVSTLKLIAGAEDESEVIFRRAAAGNLSSTASNTDLVPIPSGPNWAPSTAYLNSDSDAPETEPLADSVPPECFYLRYGSFENYLWFTDLSTEYGGDITRMATLRGFRSQSTASIESQLNLKMTQMSRMIGPTVIQDQALIGRDLFLNDGATFGVLFKVANAFLFRTSLQSDRNTRARNDDAIELNDVTIAGQKVSFLRSADNRVRSFLAEDGDTILVTNSETMVKRFLEVAQTGQSLAKTFDFQLARRLMPLQRDDTVFAYVSPQMLQGLVSPKYLVELRRRLDSKSDIALVHLARLAAANEGTPIQSIDKLVKSGYLPADFNHRIDGSGIVSLGDDLIDTRRGARGSFLPIADVDFKQVSAEEAAWYSKIAATYTSRFSHMDPIMAGVHREVVAEGSGDTPRVEQLSIHAEIAPWSPVQYGKLAQQLGPPTRVAMRFAPDDIVAVQAHVASEYLGPPTHLFAAIKDSVPPDPKDFDGLLNSYRALRQLPGYLGAWPLPGILDRLPLGIGRGTPVGPGMSRLIGGLYRYTGGEFSVLSFYPDVLNASLPYLVSVEVDDAAQIRGRVGNLLGSQLEGWVTKQMYERSAKTSDAGASFLSMLSRQLKVDPTNAMAATSNIFATDLQCTLGGEYEFAPEINHWKSTAWQNNRPPTNPPVGYTPPILKWFRGGNATLTQYEDRVVVDAVLDISRQ
ncbi:hypothetical protein CA13_32510 [Planctomycetes bacterium CA13]|uniref:Uncharacterized protein n=1 Tax=Novipirellula herctigrandis TaxID=2527986 RepID=A0A5C5Z392_9BACT|nr:hypothetical protein CA13_32510 [Planctomycetes bacterium CA13]